jgi:Bacterial SH3 domain
MRWFAKTLTGFIIAMLILGVSAVLGGKYIYAQLTSPPPKPFFPNDNPNYIKQSKKKTPKPVEAKKDEKEAKTEEKKAEEKKPLPPGAYEGRVVQPQGLILRESPEGGSSGAGGVEYNEAITVLETSPDGAWSKLRTSNNREGWVKSGNLEKSGSATEKPAEPKPSEEKPSEEKPQ